MLAQIGIRVRLEVMPNSAFVQKIREVEAATDAAKRTRWSTRRSACTLASSTTSRSIT